MRFTTVLMIYFVTLNAGALMMYETGVARDLGIEAPTTADGQLEPAENQHESISVGPGTGLTLIGMIANVATGLADVFTGLMPALRMMRPLVGDHWIAFAGSVATTILGFDLAAWIRGVRA